MSDLYSDEIVSDALLSSCYVFLFLLTMFFWHLANRKPEKPPVIKRMFWTLVALNSFLRAVYFGIPDRMFCTSYRPTKYGPAANSKWALIVVNYVLRSIPGCVFFSTFSLIVGFWASVFYAYFRSNSLVNKQTEGVLLGNPDTKRLFWFVNLFIYFAQFLIYACCLFFDNYTIFLIDALFTICLSVVAAVGSMIFAAKLHISLKPLLHVAGYTSPRITQNVYQQVDSSSVSSHFEEFNQTFITVIPSTAEETVSLLADFPPAFVSSSRHTSHVRLHSAPLIDKCISPIPSDSLLIPNNTIDSTSKNSTPTHSKSHSDTFISGSRYSDSGTNFCPSPACLPAPSTPSKRTYSFSLPSDLRGFRVDDNSRQESVRKCLRNIQMVGVICVIAFLCRAGLAVVEARLLIKALMHHIGQHHSVFYSFWFIPVTLFYLFGEILTQLLVLMILRKPSFSKLELGYQTAT